MSVENMGESQSAQNNEITYGSDFEELAENPSVSEVSESIEDQHSNSDSHSHSTTTQNEEDYDTDFEDKTESVQDDGKL